MLKLFRRHKSECLAALKSKGISTERIHTWKRCRCAVWLGGSFNGTVVPRRSLQVYTWGDAEEKQRTVEGELISGRRPKHYSVEQAVAEWLSDREAKGLKPGTMSNYRKIGDLLIRFATDHNIFRFEDFDTDGLERFKQTWGRYAVATRQLHLDCLRVLFAVASRRRWITYNPASDVEAIPDAENDVMPFEPEEVERLIAAVPGVLRSKPRRAELARHPEAFAVLLRLLHQTGLRISDALRFDPSVIQRTGQGSGRYDTRQFKNNRPVTCYLEWPLVEQIRRVPWVSSRCPFWDGHQPLKQAYNAFWGWLKEVAVVADVPGAHPHRFRHSFAVDCLNRGMQLEEVSKLLGHSSVIITEKHYAKWVQSRHERLEASLMASKVVPIDRAG